MKDLVKYHSETQLKLKDLLHFHSISSNTKNIHIRGRQPTLNVNHVICSSNNNNNTHITINNSSTRSTSETTKHNIKYIIKCNNCGQLIKRTKYSKLVANCSDYICGCGGKLTRIK